jgi:hypothetical protein
MPKATGTRPTNSPKKMANPPATGFMPICTARKATPPMPGTGMPGRENPFTPARSKRNGRRLVKRCWQSLKTGAREVDAGKPEASHKVPPPHALSPPRPPAPLFPPATSVRLQQRPVTQSGRDRPTLIFDFMLVPIGPRSGQWPAETFARCVELIIPCALSLLPLLSADFSWHAPRRKTRQTRPRRQRLQIVPLRIQPLQRPPSLSSRRRRTKPRAYLRRLRPLFQLPRPRQISLLLQPRLPRLWCRPRPLLQLPPPRQISPLLQPKLPRLWCRLRPLLQPRHPRPCQISLQLQPPRRLSLLLQPKPPRQQRFPIVPLRLQPLQRPPNLYSRRPRTKPRARRRQLRPLLQLPRPRRLPPLFQPRPQLPRQSTINLRP